MEHDMNVGAAVADVHHSLAGHAELCANLIDGRDFAVSGWYAPHVIDLTGGAIELETGPDDAFGRDDAVEGRMDDFLRRGGHDEEIELITLDAACKAVHEHVDVALEANTPTGGDEIVPADASKLRVVPQEIGEL